MGRALAARMGWSSITGDDLLVAAAAVTSPQSHPALHQMRSIGHVEYFTRGPSDRLIEDAVETQMTAWPAVGRVIRKYAIEKDPMILDWWLLSPLEVAELEHPVASFWIHVDEDVLTAREQANTAWLEGSADPKRMLANFLTRSFWRNELVLEEARSAGLPVLEQDGSLSVGQLVDEVLTQLDRHG